MKPTMFGISWMPCMFGCKFSVLLRGLAPNAPISKYTVNRAAGIFRYNICFGRKKSDIIRSIYSRICCIEACISGPDGIGGLHNRWLFGSSFYRVSYIEVYLSLHTFNSQFWYRFSLQSKIAFVLKSEAPYDLKIPTLSKLWGPVA